MYTWNQLDILEITKLFLYGGANLPPDLANESLIRKQTFLVPTVLVDAVSFMATGPGRFVTGVNIAVVDKFMSGTIFTAPGTYTLAQALSTLGDLKADRTKDFRAYEYSDALNDHAMRTYVWGSESFRLDSSAQFVVNQDGSRAILNYQIRPFDEDFDFKSDSKTSTFGNTYLQPRIDPWGIGRPVPISFQANINSIPTRTYTNADYEADVQRHTETYNPVSGLARLTYEMPVVTEKLWSSGITRFVDTQNRVIVYGSDGGDSLGLASLLQLPILGNLRQFYSSSATGLVLLGGAGGDVLTGATKNDRLVGGSGFDVYHTQSTGGNDRIEEFREVNGRKSGIVVFDSFNLTGGSRNVVVGSSAQTTWTKGDITFVTNGDPNAGEVQLTISRSGSSNSLVVEGFKNGDLGIRLEDVQAHSQLQVSTASEVIASSVYFGVLVATISDTPGSLREITGTSATQVWSGSGALRGNDLDNYLLGAYLSSSGIVEIDGGSGKDALLASEDVWSAFEHANLRGGSGTDALLGSGGDDYLDGGSENDILSGSVGNDLLEGGAGDDVLAGGGHLEPVFHTWSVDSSGDVIVLQGFDGVWQVAAEQYEEEDSDVLLGGAGNDWLYGGEFDDILDGGLDNDLLFGDSESDTLIGGGGNDKLYGDSGLSSTGTPNIQAQYHGSDYLDGGDGADYLEGDGGADQLFGGIGDDVLIGDVDGLDPAFHGADYLEGGEGVDDLWGGGGNDLLFGDEGDDLLYGEEGDDYLDGGTGMDFLYGGAGNDTYVTDAADVVVDDVGNNRIIGPTPELLIEGGNYGFFANQAFEAGTGLELVAVGAGSDIYFYLVFDNLAQSSFSFEFGEENTHTSDDFLGLYLARQVQRFGDEGANRLVGFAEDDYLAGYGGADELLGNWGWDVLDGGAGDDVLTGGRDNDTLAGGEGSDRFIMATDEGQDTVQDFADSVTSSDVIQFVDRAANQVRLTRTWSPTTTPDMIRLQLLLDDGGASADWVTVNVNESFGNLAATGHRIEFSDATSWTLADLRQMLTVVTAGDDRVRGFSGADTLDGGLGNDELAGAEGADILTGGQGDDRLYGEAGTDTLSGGTGADTVYGGEGDDLYLYALGDGSDEISDEIAPGWAGGGADTLRFGVGILPGQILAYRTEDQAGSGGDLTLVIAGGVAQIKLNDFYTTGGEIELIQFSDGSGGSVGTQWTRTQIDAVTSGGTENTQTGTAGNDVFVVDHERDAIVEAVGAGTDLVNSNVSYVLPTNVENLTLTGVLNASATGNALDNQLVGNASNNVLDGKAGHDTLTGGAGDDLYREDWDGFSAFVADTIVESAGGGYDTVQALLPDYTLAANVERLILLDGGGGQSVTWTGNASNNVIDASRVVSGGSRMVILDGGAGADTLLGHVGPNTYRVDNLGDTIVEMEPLPFSDPVVDVLETAIAYALPTGVEYLKLTGSAAVAGTGNALANTLDGSQNSAANSLAGGGGDDVYVLGAGDTVTEAAGAGHDIVRLTTGSVGQYSVASYANVEGIWLDDALLGSSLLGNSADNTLIGNASENLLTAGLGSDLLDGGNGGDTYVIGRVQGLRSAVSLVEQDRIAEKTVLGANPVGTDVIVLEGLITDVSSLRREGADLVIEQLRKHASDPQQDLLFESVRIIDHFSPYGAIEVVRFADGFARDIQQLLNIGLESTGMQGDYARGWTGPDRVAAIVGAPDLLGDAGDDVLTGNEFANSLNGEMGNDRLLGGDGDDTYVVFSESSWNPADGPHQDWIEDTDGNDVLRFSNLNYFFRPVNVTSVVRAGDDLAIVFQEGHKVVVSGHFADKPIESVVFADQTTWTATDIAALAVNGTFNVSPFAEKSLRDRMVVEKAVFSIALPTDAFIDLDAGDTLSYTMTTASGQALPGWMKFDPTTLTLHGNPMASAIGEYSLKVIATDVTGASGAQPFQLAVANVNEPPAVVNLLPDQRGRIGAAYSYVVPADTFTDVDVGDAISYTATKADGSALPAWLTFTPGTMTFAGTPVAGSTGTLSLKVIATDAAGATGFDVFDLRIGAAAVDGTSAANTLTGTDAVDDTLNGLGGNDTLRGLNGNDTLDGGTGTDIMEGGGGDDIYIVDSGTETVTEAAGAGIDQVRSSVTRTLPTNVENLTLTGSSAINGTGNTLANVLIGNSGVNTLTGLQGDDTLDGGAGQDTLVGGAGNDTYIVDNGSETVTELANEGTDLIRSSVTRTLPNNVENLTLIGNGAINGTGNTLANVLTGNAQINTLNGMDGNDTLDGGLGRDTLVGGNGNDTYVVDDSLETVTEAAGAGTDVILSSVDRTLSANVENLTLTGTAWTVGTGNTLANVITGNAGWNVLAGLDGNDTLRGLDGNDTLDGGIGSDVLEGGAGDDTYVVDNAGDTVTELASAGTDRVQSGVTITLSANVENLTLTGSGAISGTGTSVANVLIGNSGVNTLTGLQGDDTLDGGAGIDTLVGGSGNDTYVVDNSGETVTELANEGVDLVRSRATFVLATNVENLTLIGTTAINGTGNNVANILLGNSKANVLTGLDGDDTLDGGAGQDSMVGGLGNDTYVVDNLLDAATEGLNAGTDAVTSSVDWVLGDNFENLALAGTEGISGTGNDLANVLLGNSGWNVLIGMGANDTLRGFDGNDTLDGGAGSDTLEGGTGDDIYVVDSTLDTVTELANEGSDLIRSSVTLTLGANVEHLELTGTQAVNGTGNTSANFLTGNAQVNTLTGLGGDDVLDGGAGLDVLVGGTGNDTYVVDTAGETVTELSGEGTDVIFALVDFSLGSNVENLTSLGTSLALTGNSLDNRIEGDSGDNVLDGSSGSDTMIGGDGDDLFVVDVGGDAITENADEGIDTIRSSLTYTLGTNLENLTLTGASAIDGTGNGVNNVLTGNSANNTLTALGGDDTLDGQLGADTMIGGLGNDTYVVEQSGDVVTENAGEGTDTVRSDITYTLSSQLENLVLTGTGAIDGTGNASANSLTGNAGANTLTGNDGADTLDGQGGADFLAGGTGDDVYVLGRGYGADAVFENDTTAGNSDLARFMSGVAYDQIWFRQVGNDLETSIIGTADHLLIKDWYLGPAQRVEQIRTVDGNRLLVEANVQNLVNAMAAFSPPALGETTLPPSYQTALNPVIAANWQ